MSSPPAKTSLFTKIVGIVLVLIPLSCLIEELVGVFEIVGAIFTGWFFFLKRIWGTMTVDRIALVSAALCLIVVGIGIHSLCSWLYRATAAEGTQRRWPLRWSASLLVGLLLMFTAGISMVALAHQFLWLAKSPHPIYTPDRYISLRCSNNMRQIGFTILRYAHDREGRFPDTLQQLCEDTDLSPENLVCPSSSDVAARGPTTREWVAQLAMPGHLSYTYMGQGLTTATADPNRPILYEAMSNHDLGVARWAGMNILFADGRVEFFDPITAKKRLAAVAPTTLPVQRTD